MNDPTNRQVQPFASFIPSEVPVTWVRNQENFEALFADAVQGLAEFYPALRNPQVVAEIKETAKKDYDSSGNSQSDYMWLRNAVEELVPDTNV